ncbi:MAG: GAF domain-containing protein [Treponema sp.]
MQESVTEQLAQYRALIEDETDIVALMANTSAFIKETLSNLNWAGFYLLKGNELVLGPFQGKPACYRIPVGKGVCGYCAEHRQSIIVPNVHEFSGHIACDSASNSELVVPVLKDEQLFGVIDLDSFQYDNFSEADRLFIEALAKIFAEKLTQETYSGRKVF